MCFRTRLFPFSAPPACDAPTLEAPGIAVLEAEASSQQTRSRARALDRFPVHTPCVSSHPKLSIRRSTSSLICPVSTYLLWVQSFIWSNCFIHLYIWVWYSPFSSHPLTSCVFCFVPANKGAERNIKHSQKNMTSEYNAMLDTHIISVADFSALYHPLTSVH